MDVTVATSTNSATNVWTSDGLATFRSATQEVHHLRGDLAGVEGPVGMFLEEVQDLLFDRQ